MYKVIYDSFPPALGILIHAAIILDSPVLGTSTVLLVGRAITEEAREEECAWYEAVVQGLNFPPDEEYKSVLFTSMIAFKNKMERISEFPKSFPRNFRADFGRMDMGRPGRGGHGFDDGDGY